MKPSFWQRLDTMSRQSTPFVLTLILVVAGAVPLHIPGFARVAPLLSLMAVYHWAVYRPELLPAFAVFLIGLLQDTLSGTPVGVNAMVYLGVYGIVVSQSRFFTGKSFVIIWLGFALVAGVAELARWVLVSAYYVTLVEPRAVIVQYILTLGIFPFLAWVLLRWQQTFLRR